MTPPADPTGPPPGTPRPVYVDLRPDRIRPVELLVDGRWREGELEAYRRDARGWQGFVRHRSAPGLNHLEWVGEDRLRAPRSRELGRVSYY